MAEEAPREGTVRVLLVDDHEVVALGLQALIDDEDDISVVASVRTVRDALIAVETHSPDVVLMDYRLPDGTGVECTRSIMALNKPPGVVMATSVSDRRVLGQALEAGCCGFISKNADRSDLIDAIRAGAARDSYFTRDMLTHLVHLRRFEQLDQVDLTEREIAVLQATANGDSPERIAAELYLSAHTVKNHLRHAMAKLDSHTKLDAVVKAVRSRIISID